jgi:hypothetical protein
VEVIHAQRMNTLKSVLTVLRASSIVMDLISQKDLRIYLASQNKTALFLQQEKYPVVQDVSVMKASFG